MKRSFWRKQHKWFGLALCFFLLMFAVSGIILNHRGFYSKVNISRAVLPPYYKYENWNAGLLRGTLRLDSASTVIYGNSGLWKENGGKITDFNQGLPSYADYRAIRRVILLPDSSLLAVGQYGLYQRQGRSCTGKQGEWKALLLCDGGSQYKTVCDGGRQERFTDIALRGDSLVLLSRDNIYLFNYKTLCEGGTKNLTLNTQHSTLPSPEGYDGRVSLFRVVWLLHNGQMFGMPGRIVLDLLGLAMILLSLTGFCFWLCPKIWKRKRPVLGLSMAERESQRIQSPLRGRFIKANYTWHKRLGVYTFFVLLFVVITGWCLRPPMLIPLTLSEVPGIPHTAISPDDAWRDKLRAIRYDAAQGDWLLSTSDGFYSLDESLQGAPKKIPHAPHVSVMGINVFQKDADGQWLIGSLNGMWRWNREKDLITDYFTAEPMPEKAGAPFGKTPVAGFSADFGTPLIAEYYDGVKPNLARRSLNQPAAQTLPICQTLSDQPAGQTLPDQPAELRNLPMSLWQLALEVHTGRLYNLFGLAPLIWIFFIGLAALWILISGWKLRRG